MRLEAMMYVFLEAILTILIVTKFSSYTIVFKIIYMYILFIIWLIESCLHMFEIIFLNP